MNPWRARGVPVHGRGDPGLYAGLRAFTSCVFVPAFRYSVSGGEHIPDEGGVILAVTHKSWWDPVFAGMASPRPLRFMAKSELFGSWPFAGLITRLGAFPIERGAADREALRRAIEIVDEGGVLLMFPEGTRHHDDTVHEFQPGIGMLAMRSGAPVVPMAVRGTAHLVRHHLPVFPRVSVRVGPPVHLGGLEGRRSAVYTAAAERIQVAVDAAWSES